jgi:Tfp pilus assembly protein FimV
MFGSSLDIEHPFGQHRRMNRTRVRRRRLIALCMIVSLAGALSGPVANAMGVGGTAEQNAAQTYVVRPGDTLWSIATRFAPSTDPRVVVHAITSANGLDPATLVPGQQLSIPSIG